MSDIYQSHLNTRKQTESQAVALIAELARLSAQNVNVLFFGERVSLSVVDILAKHDKAGLSVADSLALTKALNVSNPSASSRPWCRDRWRH